MSLGEAQQQAVIIPRPSPAIILGAAVRETTSDGANEPARASIAKEVPKRDVMGCVVAAISDRRRAISA